MKRLTTLFLLVLLVFFATAQEDSYNNEIRTLFGSHKSLGFYGSFSLGYSLIDNEDALVSGGRAALIFNHSMALGLGGYGFVNNLDDFDDFWDDENESYALTGGYGGIFIEPIVGGLRPVHVSFQVLLGLGGVALIENYNSGYWDYSYRRSNYLEHDLFFVIEPGAELEFNLAHFFRIAATLSYRFTSDIQLYATDKDALRSLHAGLTFKFGKF